MRRPSELTHVRPATLSRRSVPSASMRSSLALASRSISRAWVRAQLAPRGDRVVAVEEQRALDQRAEVAGRHPRLLRAGRRRPQGPAPAALHRELADARPRARGARQPRRVDAGQLARVLRRLDRQQAVRALGVGELGGGEARRGGRRAPPPSSPRTARGAPCAAPATRRARGSRAAARAAAARRASSSAPAPAGRAARRGSSPPAARRSARIRRDQTRSRVESSSTIAAARHQPADAPATLTGRQETVKPVGAGSAPRLWSFSIWQYSRSMPGAVRLPQDRGVARLLELGAQRQQRAGRGPRRRSRSPSRPARAATSSTRA